MSRYTSNPFLSDWDDAGDGSTPGDATTSVVSGQARRFSNGTEGSTGNPFAAEQGSSNRRLYHRNMSSFEAASMLDDMQRTQLEGSTENGTKIQTDLIAKMTAEFQTAIATNDTDLTLETFDPFETIVDDDISLPSPALLNQSQKSDKAFNGSDSADLDEQNHKPEAELSTECTQEAPVEHDTTKPRAQQTHDSIDEDEEDLVSTPVRNLKSSPHNADQERAEYASDPSGTDLRYDTSVEKASMMASLLASAEPDQEPPVDLVQRNDHAEIATRVIAGAQTTPEAGYFDPFETVVDKDALSSLTTTSHSACREQTPEPVADQQASEDPSDAAKLDSEVTESTVEDSKFKSDYVARPRPTIAGRDESNSVVDPVASTLPKRTPAKHQKKKVTTTRKDEDSSDSSSDDDDDRIQIVIKDRDPSKGDARGASSTIVPLLPPPPSKSSLARQARERGQVDDMPSPVLSYKARQAGRNKDKLGVANNPDEASLSSDWSLDEGSRPKSSSAVAQNRLSQTGNHDKPKCSDDDDEDEENHRVAKTDDDDDDHSDHKGDNQFVIPMTLSDDDGGDPDDRAETPLYDEDTSYVLEDYPAKHDTTSGWVMMLRYPPKKKLTSNRFWKKIYVRLAQVPLGPEVKTGVQQQQPKSHQQQQTDEPQLNLGDGQTCLALQIFDKPEDKKPMQEIPIQPTYAVSDISTQQFDQFGKLFTIKLQYIFYKERVGVRQGQLARFIHSGHVGSSTTSGGHGVDPISIGAIKRMGAPIEHSPQVSQIIKLGCTDYNDIKTFKNCLEDYMFKMRINRDRVQTLYKTEEVQMAVRDETYIELNQVGVITKQMARVRLFFLSFLNGAPTIEVGVNDIHRQGKEVVGRMDILPVVTEEWIRLEACELHSTVDKEVFENPDTRIIKLVPPDATFFEVMRFRVRPPRNRELPLQINANMTVTRTKVSINCDIMVPGCVSRKHGSIPCENIAIRFHVPECWIYLFREEKHFRMGSKKSVNRRPGKVKGIERFLGGGGGTQDFNDDSSIIEVTSGQAKYEHHNQAIVWRAARWPKETQSAYVQNSMKVRFTLTAYDKMPDSYNEFVHVEYTMPATTVSHTTLRSISVNPCDDEPPEKYVKYSAKYEYKVKMRLSINIGAKAGDSKPEASPIVILKQPDLQGDLQREEDSDGDDDDDSEASPIATNHESADQPQQQDLS